VKPLALVTLAAALLGACAEDPPKYLLDGDASPAAGDGGSSGRAGNGAGALSTGGTLGNAGRSGGANQGGGEAGSMGAGESGAEGEGGAPAELECRPRSVAADCAKKECYLASCTEGRCEYEPVDAGTPCGDSLFCNGAGDCVECYEDAQCDAEGPCSVGDCNDEGRCVQQVLEAGENCEDDTFCNGDEACDGKGQCRPGGARCAEPTVCNEQARQCAGCISGDDCPAQTPACNTQGRCICTRDEHCAVADECRIGRCDVANGTCHTENVRAGTPVGVQTSGDCRSRECNGNGALIAAADDADVPPDPGGGCTRPACSAGSVVTAPRDPGARCGDAATECSAADTCNGAGGCQPNHLSSGTVLRNESKTDCRRRSCDGSGAPVETSIDAACEDGNFCTGTERCDGSTCRSSGDPCMSPRAFCVGNACHQCTGDAQCAGFKPGRAGRCVGGTCYECTDETVRVDCGSHDTGCEAGRCKVTCDCSEEVCGRSNPELCSR
jgi:hypothetical protein